METFYLTFIIYISSESQLHMRGNEIPSRGISLQPIYLIPGLSILDMLNDHWEETEDWPLSPPMVAVMHV